MADIKECIKEVKDAEKQVEKAKMMVEGCEKALEDSKVYLFNQCINGKTIKFNKLTRKYGDVRVSFSVNTNDFYKDSYKPAEKIIGKVSMTIPQKNGMSIREMLFEISDYVDFNLFYEPCLDGNKVTCSLDNGVFTINGDVTIWFFYITDAADYLVSKKIVVED